MKARLPVLTFIASVTILVAAVAAAFALPPGGTYDPGPYTACVNTKTGTIRMIEVLAGDPPWAACRSNEYSIAWADGFSIKDYSNTNYFGEDVGDPGTTTWFHQLACPEGSEPLGGGGAYLPIDSDETGGMALQSSVPTTDEDLGDGLHGWEVFFTTTDGLPHTGRFQVFVICAPAELS